MLPVPGSSPGAAQGLLGSRGMWLGEGAVSCSLLPLRTPGISLRGQVTSNSVRSWAGGGKPRGAAVGGKGLQPLSSQEERR